MRRTIILALACLFFAPGALADKKSEAKKFFRAGEQAFNAGQYPMAAQAFEEAYQRFPSPAIAFSAAQAYRLQYFVDKVPANLKRSVELYRKYLEEVKAGGRRADAAASLAELEPILQRLEGENTIEAVARKAVTKLLVSTDTKGAVVHFAKEGPKSAPLAREVSPGKYKIRVTAKGHFPYEDTVEVFEGQFRLVEVNLKAKPATIEVAKAHDGTQVVIDGRVVGELPLEAPLNLKAGKHRVVLMDRGHRSVTRDIEVGRGESMSIDAELKTTWQRKISYGVLGVGAASLAGALVYWPLAVHEQNKAIELRDKKDTVGLTLDESAEYESRRDKRNEYRDVAFALGGFGLAVGAAGALLYYLDSPEMEERSAPVVAPTVGPDSVGVGLSGRF